MMLENQLQTYFGFESFKKGQKEVISKILNDQSAAAIFPTGSGKSLCYQLPALTLPAMTLVISPLIGGVAQHVGQALQQFVAPFPM